LEYMDISFRYDSSDEFLSDLRFSSNLQDS